MRIRIEKQLPDPDSDKQPAILGWGAKITDIDSGVSLGNVTRDIHVHVPVDGVVTADLQVHVTAFDIVAELRSVEVSTARLQAMEKLLGRIVHGPPLSLGELRLAAVAALETTPDTVDITNMESPRAMREFRKA